MFAREGVTISEVVTTMRFLTMMQFASPFIDIEQVCFTNNMVVICDRNLVQSYIGYLKY